MAFRLHVACNDPDNGVFQGFADSVYLESIRFEGGRVSVSTLRPRRDGEKQRLRIGNVEIPFAGAHDWYGNWCWCMFYVAKVDALRVLNSLLVKPSWHVFEAPEEIYARLQLRVTVTPKEWREMDVTDV